MNRASVPSVCYCYGVFHMSLPLACEYEQGSCLFLCIERDAPAPRARRFGRKVQSKTERKRDGARATGQERQGQKAGMRAWRGKGARCDAPELQCASSAFLGHWDCQMPSVRCRSLADANMSSTARYSGHEIHGGKLETGLR